MLNKKILILGATGMLGKVVLEEFSLNSLYTIYALSRSQVNQCSNKIIQKKIDITNYDLFSNFLIEVNPEIIINCAANVDVEMCEKNKENSDLINADIIKTIYKSTPSAKLIYISTDSVFNGVNGSYREDDLTNPINNYAKSKLSGEINTLNLMKNSVVIRTNIYGLNDGNRKSLFEWAVDKFSRNINIFGYDNVCFNPVYTKQLANIISKLIEIDFNGVIHVGSDESISKYEFLNKIVNIFSFHEGLLKRSSYIVNENTAPRPLNTTLSTKRLFEILGYIPSLDQGLNNIKKDYELKKMIKK
jgi:dTDP-4-dehydrorhamnose reductase